MGFPLFRQLLRDGYLLGEGVLVVSKRGVRRRPFGDLRRHRRYACTRTEEQIEITSVHPEWEGGSCVCRQPCLVAIEEVIERGGMLEVMTLTAWNSRMLPEPDRLTSEKPSSSSSFSSS